jgi:DNA adenine methylase
MKTFIRWSGNKTKYLKIISSYIPTSYKVYIEPFVGSGALFLYLQPSQWIINDMNKDLINTWKYIQKEPHTLIKIAKGFSSKFGGWSKEEKIKNCRWFTSTFSNLKFNAKRAALYLIMKYLVLLN